MLSDLSSITIVQWQFLDWAHCHSVRFSWFVNYLFIKCVDTMWQILNPFVFSFSFGATSCIDTQAYEGGYTGRMMRVFWYYILHIFHIDQLIVSIVISYVFSETFAVVCVLPDQERRIVWNCYNWVCKIIYVCSLKLNLRKYFCK